MNLSEKILFLWLFACMAAHCSAKLQTHCNETVTCKSENSICVQNKCECKPLYKEHKSECIERKNLGETCHNKTESCPKHAECIAHGKNKVPTCHCKPNYRVSNNVLCLPKSKKLMEACNKTENCPINAECTSDGRNKHSTCQCKPNYYSNSNTTCHPKVGLGKSCSTDNECNSTNSECKLNICQCKSAFKKYNASCIGSQKIGELCSQLENCPFNAECTSNGKSIFSTCKCKPNFYTNNNTTCLPQVALGKSCSTDNECNTTNSECKLNICQCKSTFTKYNTTCIKNQKIGEICNQTESCPSNAECTSDGKSKFSTCKCQPNFYTNNNTTCVPQVELGKSCSADNECKSTNSECKSKICQCKSTFTKINASCIKSKNLGEMCNNKTDICPSNAECMSAGKNRNNSTCTCKPNFYMYNNKTCLPQVELHENCNVTIACKIANSQCDKNKCECDLKFKEYKATCIESNKLGEICNRTENCPINAECTSDAKNKFASKKCTCKPNYIVLNATCVHKGEIKVKENVMPTAELRTTCNGTVTCRPPNSQCNMNKCECKPQFKELKTECIESKKLGETCNKTENCPMNADCVSVGNNKFSICHCKPNYYMYNNMMCLPQVELGKNCSTDNECKTTNSECKLNVCQCKFMFKKDNASCVKYKKTGELCSSKEECPPNGYCISFGRMQPKKCSCNRFFYSAKGNSACTSKGTSSYVHASLFVCLVCFLLNVFTSFV